MDGPGPSRIVRLMLGGEDIAMQQSGGQGEGEGKRRALLRPLQRSESTAYKSCLFALIFFFLESSFYPGLNGVNSILNVETDNLADAIPDKSQFEDEDDWIDVPSVGKASQVHPSKFSEAVANEVSSRYLTHTFVLQPLPQRPTWKGSHPTSGLLFIIPGGADTSLGQGTAPTAPRLPLATETAVPTDAGEYCCLCPRSQ